MYEHDAKIPVAAELRQPSLNAREELELFVLHNCLFAVVPASEASFNNNAKPSLLEVCLAVCDDVLLFATEYGPLTNRLLEGVQNRRALYIESDLYLSLRVLT